MKQPSLELGGGGGGGGGKGWGERGGVGRGARGEGELRGDCGTSVRVSISKPTPFIYLAFENTDPLIY